MEIAGLVLLIVATAYGGIKLYWAWQDRREEKKRFQKDLQKADPESKLISDPAAVAEAWRHRPQDVGGQYSPLLGVLPAQVAAAAFVTGLILLLLSRL